MRLAERERWREGGINKVIFSQRHGTNPYAQDYSVRGHYMERPAKQL